MQPVLRHIDRGTVVRRLAGSKPLATANTAREPLWRPAAPEETDLASAALPIDCCKECDFSDRESAHRCRVERLWRSRRSDTRYLTVELFPKTECDSPRAAPMCKFRSAKRQKKKTLDGEFVVKGERR